ncbi:MAG: PQQ-binding-like beta-propeller repeat protein [Bdellovibrionales bacterium]
MDYDKRHVKWYWLFLFLVYCGAVIYLLFAANPYLYSHHELRAAMNHSDSMELLTIPAESGQRQKLTDPTFFSRFNFSHSAVDPVGSPRNKNYTEFKKYPVQLNEENFTVEKIAQDPSGFYLASTSPWIISVGLTGEVRWKFRMRDLGENQAAWAPLLDQETAYIFHPGGEVYGVNKETGTLVWTTRLDDEIISQPFMWKDELIIPVEREKGPIWLRLHRADGRVAPKKIKLDIASPFEVSLGPGGKSLLFTTDNKLYSVDPNTWEIVWSLSVTDPIKGPAVVAESQIFLATLGAKIVKVDGGKKAKVDWEVDLEKAPASPPSFLPVVNRLSVQLVGGTLVAIDVKLGKVLWSYNNENHNPLTDTWSVRLSAKHIEEFKMDWLHKGWTIWSACGSRKICIYTPNKGQLVERIVMSASPMTLPLPVEKTWISFGEIKPGQYEISHLLEQSEIKKILAESATETQKPQ